MFGFKSLFVLLILLIWEFTKPVLSKTLSDVLHNKFYQKSNIFSINQDRDCWRSYENPCPSILFAFQILIDEEDWLLQIKESKQLKELEALGINFITIYNGSFCNQSLIEDICIDDVRSFIKIQTEKNLNNITWNVLKESIKTINLTSIKIDKSLNPCLVLVFYCSYYRFFADFFHGLLLEELNT